MGKSKNNPPKRVHSVSTWEFHRFYEKKCKERGIEPRPYRKFKAFYKSLFILLFKKMVHEMWHFVLPYGCGDIFIKKIKGGTSIDWNHFNKTGEKRRLLNLHTFKKVYVVEWSTQFATCKNKQFLKFKCARGHTSKEVYGTKYLKEYLFKVAEDPSLKLLEPRNVTKRSMT